MFWLKIFSWFSGLDIGGIAETAAKAYAAKQDAGVKRDAIDADLAAKAAAISVQEAELNARIVIAEQGNWLTRMARPAIAFPFIVYLWKVILWDKVLGLGVTDALGNQLAAIMATIIGSYFIGRTIEKTVSTIRGTSIG